MIGFKPFDKVLVRQFPSHHWIADIFSHICKKNDECYMCIGGAWNECISYKGNEHLIGTTSNPSLQKEFKFGDKVVVRNNEEGEWERATFVRLHDYRDSSFPFLVIIEGKNDTEYCSFCHHANW